MKILKKIPLCEHTTLKLGGPATFFVSVTTISELKEVLLWADKNRHPSIVIGGGSNILFPDIGWDGLVIHMNIRGIRYEKCDGDVCAIVEAGENWDTFVHDSIKRNLWGLENLSAIPGSVGATPVQNIGAYGVEVSQKIKWVEVYNTSIRKIERLSPKECSFRYRNSLFKTSFGYDLIVTTVCFALSEQAFANLSYKDLSVYFQDVKVDPTLSDIRDAVVAIRRQKFPDLRSVGSAGSFFKNPIISNEKGRELKKKYPELPIFALPDEQVKISLAWILDNVLNLNGVRDRNVGVFKRQSLVLVNYGEASVKEFISFADKIKLQVLNEVGITLVPEVHIVKNKS